MPVKFIAFLSFQFLEQCDEIIVMQRGKVAERGTHSELMERKGDYFDMVGLDSAGKEKKDHEEKPPKKKKEEVDSVGMYLYLIF